MYITLGTFPSSCVLWAKCESAGVLYLLRWVSNYRCINRVLSCPPPRHRLVESPLIPLWNTFTSGDVNVLKHQRHETFSHQYKSFNDVWLQVCLLEPWRISLLTKFQEWRKHIYQFNIMLIHRTEHTFSKYPSEDFDHFTIVKDIDNSE